MERNSLRELTNFYFKRNKNNCLDYDYKINRNQKFDIIITKNNNNPEGKNTKIGVFICDIHRSIGLNVLRKIQCMLEDSEEINNAILVGKDFSSQVRKFRKSYNDVKLLSQAEIKRNIESKWDY